MTERDHLSQLLEDNPELIREFLDLHPAYEQLCSEIAYILRQRLKSKNVEFTSILSRAKTLESFADKLLRKQYVNPIQDITDLAGARVVFLYNDDRCHVEDVIESEFNIVKKTDRVGAYSENHFGYLDLQYVVRLSEQSSGARYDDLKDLVCEIQVRTIMQDAWALAAHNLSYKSKEKMSELLGRRLNRLAGLFEIADDEFTFIRTQREKRLETLRRELDNEEKFLSNSVDFDALSVYLKLRFRDLPLATDDAHISRLVSRLDMCDCKTFQDIDLVLSRTERAREEFGKEIRSSSAADEVVRALAFTCPQYRDSGRVRDRYRQLYVQLLDLVTNQ